MRISAGRVKRHCQKSGLGLSQALKQAGISRTAYYSLVRKSSVLPHSLLSLAAKLKVKPSALLEDISADEAQLLSLRHELDQTLRRYPTLDPDNVWHTLLLLEEEPIERLKRSLTRGRNQRNIY